MCKEGGGGKARERDDEGRREQSRGEGEEERRAGGEGGGGEEERRGRGEEGRGGGEKGGGGEGAEEGEGGRGGREEEEEGGGKGRGRGGRERREEGEKRGRRTHDAPPTLVLGVLQRAQNIQEGDNDHQPSRANTTAPSTGNMKTLCLLKGRSLMPIRSRSKARRCQAHHARARVGASGGPLDETRAYVKLVLRNLGLYERLYAAS